MRQDLTDITMVLDRSGSMYSCRDESEGGVNQFIEDQKKAEGGCTLSLVQFDDKYEFVHKGVDIKNVGKYTLVPRGMTALLDAVGKAVTETGERLAAMSESQRPGTVIFVIVTDGGENCSKEYTKVQIKEVIERQQNDYKWQFVFLGANQDAFTEASSIGINLNTVSNYSTSKSAFAYDTISTAVSNARASAFRGGDATLSLSDEDRAKMV